MKKILLTIWTIGASLTGIFAQQESLILDINPGAYSSNTSIKGREGNKLILSSDDGVHGFEIWTTDGTTAGTQLYWDVLAGAESSYSVYEGTINSDCIFLSRATSLGQYWIVKSDLSTSTSSVLAVFSPTGAMDYPDNFCSSGNKMFFTAETTTEGKEIWVTDGTMGGTQMLKDIIPGSLSSSPNELIAFQGYVYFSASDINGDRELWRTDGTTMGTQRFVDINLTGASSPMFFSTGGNNLYFSADDGVHGRELWKSDGTPGGTVMVKDLLPGSTGVNISKGYDFNGKYVFVASTPAEGAELWISDGTSSGTFMLKDIEPGSQGGMQYLSGYASTTNKLLFFATTSAEGTEPWITDGTTSGTYRLKDIQTGAYGSVSTHTPLAYNGKFYFIAYNDVIGREIYESDGTTLGTNAITDIDVSALGYGPDPWGKIVELNGDLIFTASDATHGSELWKLELGTNSVGKISPEENWFTVYPNPVSDLLNIKLSVKFDDVFSIQLFNILGEEVQVVPSCVSSIDCSNLQNGNYFLKLNLKDGRIQTKKIIVTDKK